MCGICGWIDQRPVDSEILESMVLELRHRGPDAQQIKLLNNVGLGHARLSIIDLSTSANQPMPNEDKSIWLVYNGEFYTFQSFRNELIEKGHRFISQTDSEVLLHLYEESGPEFIKELRGMFAFALWDNNQQRLILARDRVGIKPLYYFHKGDTFLFASELKALLKHPDVARDLSPEALSYYFMLGYVPREHCILKSIKKLLPGHYLLFEKGRVSTHCYWRLPVQADGPVPSDHECAEMLMERLEESVKMRLISDVPLGVFLSGGVDSSIVAALMSRHSSKPVNTFSIGFEEAKYNELPYARLIADHIGSKHTEFIVRLDHAEALDGIVNYYDEPFADDSAIPTYYVSKMAKDHVTVVLSGDGGDELFGGYNWYDWVLRRKRFNFLPPSWLRAIASLSSLPSFNFKGKHFLNILALDEFETFMERTGLFLKGDLQNLIDLDFATPLSDSYQEYYKHSGRTVLDRLTRTDFHYYLPDDILTKVDRASMSVSLEARVPLLDHRVCEFAFALPDSLKIRKGVRKYLLKEIAKQILPKDFPLERKQGFSIPLSEWMRGALGDRLMDLSNNKHSMGLLSKRFIEKLYMEHKRGKYNHSRKLYAILNFYLWNQKFLCKSS